MPLAHHPFERSAAGACAATVAFVAIVLIHPLQALNCRSDQHRWWRLPPNRLIWVSFLVLLGTVPLRGQDWMVIAFAVAWPVMLFESFKTSRTPVDQQFAR